MVSSEDRKDNDLSSEVLEVLVLFIKGRVNTVEESIRNYEYFEMGARHLSTVRDDIPLHRQAAASIAYFRKNLLPHLRSALGSDLMREELRPYRDRLTRALRYHNDLLRRYKREAKK